MSDAELAPVVGVNLEDDGPPVETPPPAAPVEAVAPVTPVGELEDTLQPADLVDTGKAQGLIGAVKGLRTEKVALKGENETLRQTIAQQTQMLQTFQQLQQTLRPAAPQGPAPVDPNAEAFARKLDYLNVDGTPNLQRGAEIAQLIREEAGKIAAQQMAPLAERQARTASLENFQRAAAATATNGLKASVETLTTLWQTMPIEYTANPEIARTLWVTAIGMDAAGGKKVALPTVPAVPLLPPLTTEAIAGAAVRTAKPLTEGERQVLSARGMKEETYRKHTETFQKGRASVLEDD